MSVTEQLYQTLLTRKSADPSSSYTAALFHKGLDAILKKIAEESGEVLLAAKNLQQAGNTSALCYELADLHYHCLVLMAASGVQPADLDKELARRMGVSGLAEKAARST